MEDERNIEELFKKLVNNQLSEEEYETFIDIIRRENSEEELQRLLGEHLQSKRVLQKSNSERKAADVEQLYNQIIYKIENEQRLAQSKRRKFKVKSTAFRNFYKIAAMLILLGGLFYFYKNHSFLASQENDPSIPATKVDNITLKLGNGEMKLISGNAKQNILGAKGDLVAAQNGSRLNYTKRDNFKEVVYNELTVPYGKQFDVVLADGTQVTLNAGSWIKYPVQFNEANRKVFLKGEAYFDVAKDKAHPFIVNTGTIDVEVLGTQFNVSNYPEEAQVNTVLVEGSVKLYEENKKDDKASSTKLSPGHKASWDIKKMEMAVEKVDVSRYIAWRKGVLKFENTPFHTIRKQLERHFNVSIENRNEFLKKQIYTATFKGENIEEILNAFSVDTPFKYKINNDHIIITK